eukprot:3524974-Amphidinium_carterae.1
MNAKPSKKAIGCKPCVTAGATLHAGIDVPTAHVQRQQHWRVSQKAIPRNALAYAVRQKGQRVGCYLANAPRHPHTMWNTARC